MNVQDRTGETRQLLPEAILKELPRLVYRDVRDKNRPDTLKDQDWQLTIDGAPIRGVRKIVIEDDASDLIVVRLELLVRSVNEPTE